MIFKYSSVPPFFFFSLQVIAVKNLIVLEGYDSDKFLEFRV